MSAHPALVVERWTRESRIALAVAALAAVLLALGPLWLDANSVDRLTTLFIYVILAVTWNALVGYCGLVSIGQQAFFGLGAYFAVRLADSGVSVYPSLFLSAIVVGALSLPLSALMLRLKGGEFAIGMWVASELAHLLVNLDTLINGETGTSLIALNAYPTELPYFIDNPLPFNPVRRSAVQSHHPVVDGGRQIVGAVRLRHEQCEHLFSDKDVRRPTC